MSNILVKVSGDLVDTVVFAEWVWRLPGNPPTIIAGAGTAITQQLEAASIPYHFGPAGRETTEKGQLIARVELLRTASVVAKLGTPLLPMWPGTHLMLNGDDLALALYPNFHRVYIVTAKGRNKHFAPKYNRLEVVHLELPR